MGGKDYLYNQGKVSKYIESQFKTTLNFLYFLFRISLIV